MSVAGKWNVSMDTPIGRQQFSWHLEQSPEGWTGAMDTQTGRAELRDIRVSGDEVSFGARVNSPMGSVDVTFQGAVDGDRISGACKTMFGDMRFAGTRA